MSDDLSKLMANLNSNREVVKEKPKKVEVKPVEKVKVEEIIEEKPVQMIKKEEVVEKMDDINLKVEQEVMFLQNNGVFRRELLISLDRIANLLENIAIMKAKELGAEDGTEED